MEFTISQTPLKAKEFKPEAGLDKYISFLQEDIKKLFPESERSSRVCPGCGACSEEDYSFRKLGFEFKRCKNCLTVYASSVPDQNQINDFYKKSKARAYWKNELWKDTEEARQKKILLPIIDWINQFVGKASEASFKMAEVCPNNDGFRKSWEETGSKIETIDRSSWNKQTSRHFDSICLFDALDRSINPKEVFEKSYSLLKKGGHCFVTSILSTGLDSFFLGDKSLTLLPPDRLNAFSFEAIKLMAKESGFEILELSTPGNLDLDYIKSGLQHTEGKAQEFFRYLFETRKDDILLSQFQKFLQENRLSSRLRMVLQKK